MSEENLFRRVLVLVKAGNKAEARRLLAEEIDQNPHNADAWLAMARLVDDQERASYYAERALEVRPGDQQTQKFLDQLRASGRAAPMPEDHAPPRPTMPPRSPSTGSASPKPRRRIRLLPVLAILAGIVIAGFAGGALLRMLGSGGGATIPNPDQDYTVLYRVSASNDGGGFNPVSLTYLVGGQPQTEQIEKRTWVLTLTQPFGTTVSLTVEDLGIGGEVKCEILIDGEVWRSETTHSREGPVTCEGRLGTP
jgi:hypothetical protein